MAVSVIILGAKLSEMADNLEVAVRLLRAKDLLMQLQANGHSTKAVEQEIIELQDRITRIGWIQIEEGREYPTLEDGWPTQI